MQASLTVCVPIMFFLHAYMTEDKLCLLDDINWAMMQSKRACRHAYSIMDDASEKVVGVRPREVGIILLNILLI